MSLRRYSSSLVFRAVIVSAIAATSFGLIATADETPATKPAEAPKAPEATPETPKAPEAPAEKPATPDPKPEAKPDAKPAAPSLKGTMCDSIYFKDFDGNAIGFPEAVGKVMIIEVWATWCGPCRRQRELMHDLSTRHPEVVFVGASVDEAGPRIVRDFISKHATPKDSTVRDVMATPELQAALRKKYPSNTIPKLAFVNKRGQLVEVTGSQDPKFTEAMIKNLNK